MSMTAKLKAIAIFALIGLRVFVDSVVDYGFLKGTVIDRKTGYGNVQSLSVALYVLVWIRAS